MSLPQSVRIVEVGPRDGLQNEPVTLNSDLRVEFINRLIDCGLTTIEAGSFVNPKWVPQMRDTHDVLTRLSAQKEIQFPVLVPNLQGLEDAIAAGAQEVAIFAAASETFSHKNINCSIAQSLDRFEVVCAAAKDHNILVRGYISCVMGCPYEGDVSISVTADIANHLQQLGCYEISLGDTIGVGTALQTQQLIRAVQKKIGIKHIAVHFHDTYGQALTNIFSALQMGVATIDSAVAGLGGCPYANGASGNVATEDVVYLLNGLSIHHGIDLNKLVGTGRFICTQLQRPVVSRVNQAIA